MMRTLPIHLPLSRIADFCRRYGIARLSLFGSVLRDDFTPESDLDMLVEFLPGRIPGLITFVGLEQELTDLIGRKVDLNTPKSLSKYFVDEVLEEAVPIYVAA